MNCIFPAILGCLFLAVAAFLFIPALLASPIVFLRSPKLSLGIWGAWLYIIIEGLHYLLDAVRLLFVRRPPALVFHQESPPRPPRRRFAEVAPRIPTPPLSTVYEFEPEIPESCKRTDVTPPARLSRRNSGKFTFPAQDTGSPTSRGTSSTLSLEEILQMKNTVRNSGGVDIFDYDLDPEGPSRLSSRRSSRAASTVDLRSSETSMESGAATPRLSRSRTGSFTHISNLPSRNTSTSSLSAVPESLKRHKRARTDGSLNGS
ncbi:hypothetical protein CKM354_000024200 [Cercospora kikuchii]|uniref:Uncharacterized protein n=1 Tax=Cercospora kikuchii TaxID=84275 RepID=A0A9P3CAX5_9PEZI|nr:uncharacterized protein CKM354_000024200 [Cercospora kikuchii]GIZ36775.1 hypothetical protein CKM354_000024200 [Cercospora kikuchii]